MDSNPKEQECVDSLRENIAQLEHAADLDVEGIIEDVKKVLAMLVASDALAKASIQHAQRKSYSLPKGGIIQLGFVLYWLKHKPAALKAILDKLPKRLRRVIEGIIDLIVVTHEPTVTPDEYGYMLSQLHAGGIVSPAGEILATGEFEGADTGWLWAFFNYLVNLIDPSDIAPFIPESAGKPEPYRGTISTAGTTKIAIIGDWGTGEIDSGGGANA